MLKFSYRSKYIRYRKEHTKLCNAYLHVYYILLCSDNKSVTNVTTYSFFSLTDNVINNVYRDIGCKLFTVILANVSVRKTPYDLQQLILKKCINK